MICHACFQSGIGLIACSTRADGRGPHVHKECVAEYAANFRHGAFRAFAEDCCSEMWAGWDNGNVAKVWFSVIEREWRYMVWNNHDGFVRVGTSDTRYEACRRAEAAAESYALPPDCAEEEIEIE